MSKGNTEGLVTGQSASAAVPASAANQPVKPGMLESAKTGTQQAIDNWVERNGYSTSAMVAGALGTAVTEVFMPTAAWELIPVGKAAKLLKKGAELAGLSKKGENATEAAQDVKKAEAAPKSKDGAKFKPRPKKKLKCHCATKSEGYKNAKDKQKYLKDYQRQLDMQQANLNMMSANDFKAARDAFEKNGRNPFAEGMQKKVGKKFLNDVTENVRRSLLKKNPNMPYDEATALATQKAKDIKSNLAALHNPDMKAGGYNSPMPSGMGDASINSSIGSSWNQDKRIEDMDSHVDDAIKSGAGDEKMNVELKVCTKKDCSE